MHYWDKAAEGSWHDACSSIHIITNITENYLLRSDFTPKIELKKSETVFRINNKKIVFRGLKDDK